MGFGLQVTGDQQQLIIGDDYPVLTRKLGGRIRVTNPIRGYGICRVYYVASITTELPPLIFVTPTSTCDGKGLGLFSHIGGPGNWQGFSVAAVRSIEGASGNISAGFDTGWNYHVCVFGDPGVPLRSDDTYGLELYSTTIKTFDSRWDIVFFKELLRNWAHHSFTRSYSYVGRTQISNNGSYWGNAHFSEKKAYDLVLAKATHPWGAVDGDKGFMLSSLGAVPIRADVGYSEGHHTQDTVVMVGFPSSSRTYLMATAFYGGAQHPSANITALNRLNILTGDFSKIRGLPN